MRWRLIEEFLQDVRYGWQNPGVTSIAIITLALGIGASSSLCATSKINSRA
jgi:hypothetical protein